MNRMPYFKYSMNDEEYKQKLAQVAEFTMPKITGTGNTKTIKRGRKSLEEQYQEAH